MIFFFSLNRTRAIFIQAVKHSPSFYFSKMYLLFFLFYFKYPAHKKVLVDHLKFLTRILIEEGKMQTYLLNSGSFSKSIRAE